MVVAEEEGRCFARLCCGDLHEVAAIRRDRYQHGQNQSSKNGHQDVFGDIHDLQTKFMSAACR